MADYQLRARIPDELANKLFEVIKEVQENTLEADVTTSSITRAAIEQYIREFEEKKSRKVITIKIPNEMTDSELKEFTNAMESAAEKIKDDTGLKKAYQGIELEALRESILRKI